MKSIIKLSCLFFIILNSSVFAQKYDVDESNKTIEEFKEIDPNIKLSCEDPLPELDTCKDLCNDRSYFLRRLQRHDPKLFNYNTPSEKYKKYSKN